MIAWEQIATNSNNAAICCYAFANSALKVNELVDRFTDDQNVLFQLSGSGWLVHWALERAQVPTWTTPPLSEPKNFSSVSRRGAKVQKRGWYQANFWNEDFYLVRRLTAGPQPNFWIWLNRVKEPISLTLLAAQYGFWNGDPCVQQRVPVYIWKSGEGTEHSRLRPCPHKKSVDFALSFSSRKTESVLSVLCDLICVIYNVQNILVAIFKTDSSLRAVSVMHHVFTTRDTRANLIGGNESVPLSICFYCFLPAISRVGLWSSGHFIHDLCPSLCGPCCQWKNFDLQGKFLFLFPFFVIVLMFAVLLTIISLKF